MSRMNTANLWKHGHPNQEIEQLQATTVVDAGECKVLEQCAPNRPRSLLAALMVRAGALAPLPQVVKRGRGRPRKGSAV